MRMHASEAQQSATVAVTVHLPPRTPEGVSDELDELDADFVALAREPEDIDFDAREEDLEAVEAEVERLEVELLELAEEEEDEVEDDEIERGD